MHEAVSQEGEIISADLVLFLTFVFFSVFQTKGREDDYMCTAEVTGIATELSEASEEGGDFTSQKSP